MISILLLLCLYEGIILILTFTKSASLNFIENLDLAVGERLNEAAQSNKWVRKWLTYEYFVIGIVKGSQISAIEMDGWLL